MSLEKQVYCQPRMHELYRGVRGHAPPEKKNWKLDSRKRHILHSLDRTQLIHTSILLSFQFSVSLFIIPVRCFQSHFKVKQIASYSTRSHSSSPANQSVFKCAIQLWLCNSVNITCTAIVFQAVLDISVTQNPLVRADRPKVPRKLQPSPNYGLKKS